ncbi:MAG: response regulator transcription factor [Chloroflexi bacterium]|nr:response regulator transcription factor [Chloroflexota bacterium]
MTTSKGSILVVDDEPEICQLLREWLQREGYTIYEANDGFEGLRLFFQHHPDLAILDILMPKMDGLELCQRIREVSAAPVIFLTALGREMDKVKGLTLGADDYITKPFGRKELLARIEAALRRFRTPSTTVSTVYSDDILSVDFARHEVLVSGQEIKLTPTEFRLLSLLINNAGKVVSLEEILDKVWGPEYESLEPIKWYISHLRRKIGDDPQSPHIITNVRGIGYRYERPVKKD